MTDGNVWQLRKAMYGTRKAADSWQEEYSTMMIQDLGFRQGSSCANVFWHETRRIRTSVHGDDFTSVGPKSQLDWLEAAISSKYEMTAQPRLGPALGDAKEDIVLNRVVRWLDNALEI